MIPGEAAYIVAVHAMVDGLVAPLSKRLGARLVCRLGCSSCCVDDLTVFEVEAAPIRLAYPEVLAGEPAAVGGCAMLGPSGECRVYAARPYVCRTQGLPLRWAEAGVEHRDICRLNDNEDDLLSLSPEDCWTLGPVESRLAAAQARSVGGEGLRVSLRSLFQSPVNVQANR